MSINNLVIRAQQIRNERIKSKNTTERVGSLLEDMVRELGVAETSIKSAMDAIRTVVASFANYYTQTEADSRFMYARKFENLDEENGEWNRIKGFSVDAITFVYLKLEDSVRSVLIEKRNNGTVQNVIIANEVRETTIDINFSAEMTLKSADSVITIAPGETIEVSLLAFNNTVYMLNSNIML